jgi:hypothetical protein
MGPNVPIKYFIHARKSTESEDRQARSIGDQLAELRANWRPRAPSRR